MIYFSHMQKKAIIVISLLLTLFLAKVSTVSAVTDARALINEPNIRVRLYTSDKPVKFEADFPYNIYSGQEVKGILYAGEPATVSFNDGVYNFVSTDLDFSSSDPIRFVPDELTYYFKLTNYTRKVSGRGGINFNTYRGVMEYRYSPKNDIPYIINELPLDEYVAGVAESANDVAPEYAKALLVAARSYAYQMIAPTTEKHLFDIYPTTVDQIYLGYNSELVMPKIVQAEQDTYGEMVTYNGNPVLTPYFGHSNGHTLDFKPIKGGQKRPWLKSVVAKYDKGLKLWGHGLGMSTHDASQRALKDGWTYEEILKYYYSNTEVEKIY